MEMRAALLSSILLLASACTRERIVAPAPQPQKIALSMCYSTPCATPIFIVDGKRLRDDSADLDPSNIETVEVVKGAVAIARYGEEARNGAVVITSKRVTGRKSGT